MTYDETRRKYVVRWRNNGHRHIKRFDTSEEAEVFEQSLRPAPIGAEPHASEVAALTVRLAELERGWPPQLTGEMRPATVCSRMRRRPARATA